MGKIGSEGKKEGKYVRKRGSEGENEVDKLGKTREENSVGILLYPFLFQCDLILYDFFYHRIFKASFFKPPILLRP